MANLFGHSYRRVTRANDRRLHVELRDIDPPDFDAYARRLEAGLDKLAGVEWVRINGHLARAVVSYRSALVEPAQIVAVIDGLEEHLGLADAPFSGPKPEHPADNEPVIRKWVALSTDALAVALGVGLKVVGRDRSSLNFAAAALTNVVDNTPRFRRALEEVLNVEAVDVGFGALHALVQAVGSGPVGPGVDFMYQAAKLRGETARQRVWQRLEPQLCYLQWDRRRTPVDAGQRPRPLPDGLIETYADEAFLASAGGFVVGLADTHNLEASTPPLFGGLPKAARYGRDGFVAALVGELSERDILTLCPPSLAGLDRVDTVVVDADLFVGDAGGLDPSAEQLLVGVDRAGLTLVVAGDGPALDPGIGIDEVVADTALGDMALGDIVRARQRDGAVVALVAAGPSSALAAADLAVGICRPGDGPPWAADVVCVGDLDCVAFVLEACTRARRVAEQSVAMAGLGAAIATFVSLRGLQETRADTVMLGTNAVALLALANGVRHATMLGRTPRPARRDTTPWHRLDIAAVMAALGSTPDGLHARQVRSRRRDEPDEPTRLERVGRAVAQELANPFTPVLAGAAAVSAVVGSAGDAAMVGAAMGLNAVIGGVERYKAERAVDALADRETGQVRVIRAGKSRLVAAADIVVGDVVEIRSGDVIPADCRLVEAHQLEVDQSSLTGESLPVAKSVAPAAAAAVAERSSMVYASTSVAVGWARAVVVAVGADTETRRSRLTQMSSAPRTGVEQRLESLTDITMPVAGISGLFLVGSGLARDQDIQHLVDAAVGMSVAAVPEGLPILSTVAQLSAARRLAARGVLVQNPRAVEGLGRIDVVCADKTGTLTEGRIELGVVCDGHDCTSVGPDESRGWARKILAAAMRASPAPPADGRLAHPTDRAVVDGARAAGICPADGFKRWGRLDELPFEPGRGYHAVLGQTDRGQYLTIKGAPEVVLPRCSERVDADGVVALDAPMRDRLVERAKDLAGRGLRVLAVAEQAARRDVELDESSIENFCFRGFVGLSDPVRPSAAAAVEKLNDAGVAVVMITGDHPRTAHRIAVELGLAGPDTTAGTILTGAEIDQMTDDDLDQALLQATVIARATPANKVRIVQALQRDGRVVAMTGDGANDASAIGLADVGIALGEDATTAAREAADIVVVDERIDTMVRAVAEGRAMWHSVRDAVSILTGGNFGEIGFTLLASILGEPPLNARQLLLINLLTDIAPSLSIVMRRPTADDLRRALADGPEDALGDTLDRAIIDRALTTGGGATAAWFVSRAMAGSRPKASTVALLAAVGTQLGQTLAVGKPTRQTLLASLGSAAILLGVVETPGLSRVAGCRPVGPIGLATAVASSALATGASAAIPPAYRKARQLGQTLANKLREMGNHPTGREFHPDRRAEGREHSEQPEQPERSRAAE